MNSMDNRVFSEKLLSRCISSPEQIDIAIRNGKRYEYQDLDGLIVAYKHRGKIYVTECKTNL